MKRLILMGGRPWLAGDGGRRFVQVLLRYYPAEVKLAFCNFAQDETDWQETTKTNVDMFSRFNNGRAIEHKIMTTENLAEISAWADVIYVPGGDPNTLLAKLKRFELEKLWATKSSLQAAQELTVCVLTLSICRIGHLVRVWVGSKRVVSRIGATTSEITARLIGTGQKPKC